MATQMTPGFWANMDPANAGDLLDLQRKQALAQMLLQRGMEGGGGTQMAGRVAVAQSPFEGLGRLAQVYMGNKMMGDYAEKLGYLNRQGYAKMTGQPTMADTNQGPQPQHGLDQGGGDLSSAILNQGAGQGSVGPTNDNAQRLAAALQGQAQQPMPQPAPQQPAPLAPGGSLNPGNMPTQLAGFGLMSDPGAYFTAQASAVAPTPEMKMAAQVYGANSPQYKAAIESQVQKAGYIAPVNARPGSILRDPRTNQPIAFNPHVPENGLPVFDASGNVVAVRPLSGANELIQGQEQAKGLGKAGATPTVAYDPNGQPIFSTQLQDVARAQGWTPPAASAPPAAPKAPFGNPALQVTQDPAAFRAQLEKIKDPQERQMALDVFDRSAPQGSEGAPQGRATPVLPPGASTAADEAQRQLAKKFADLQQQNSQAQTTTSYLQNIKQLAATAATGQFSDKQTFINSLLSTAGVSEKATDAVTANNLLNKYGNQIVARLGQGGLGTDSARAILQSAYPNAHMTPQAINEAADNLIGANEMVKAKINFLSPHGNAKDPVGYQQKEQVFDQAADPRLWQLKGMTPQQAQSYLSAMPPQVRADLQQRARVLKQLGAL